MSDSENLAATEVDLALQLAAIVESSDDAIIGKDLNGTVTSWNRGAERLFGYTAAEMIGRAITTVIPPERHSEEPAILERIRRGERVDHFETVRRRKDGALIDVSLTISPIKNFKGRVVGASKIAREITQRKLVEMEIAHARDQALAASRAKDDFLAALSHELRTPLSPVLLIASEGAANRRLPASVRADFETIRKNVELEARLLGDLLDLTRITHNKLALEMSSIRLHVVLEDALATVRGEIERKKIRLTCEFGASQDGLWGDGVRLQQVFWNILTNAVKFTLEGGSIVVSTRAHPDESKIIVGISDSGMGLTAHDLAKVFEAFAQGGDTVANRNRRHGGLGLGLAISRTLVQLHRGEIRAASAGRDRGAEFTVELPLRPRAEGGEEPAAGAPLETETETGPLAFRGRILLVDDHAPTRATLASLLTRRRYDVLTAGSTTEALSLAGRERFDLLISDIGLPDGDGCSLMETLRDSQPGLKGIALSGYGMDSDIARSRGAGFTEHLIKPISFSVMERMVAAVLHPPPAA